MVRADPPGAGLLRVEVIHCAARGEVDRCPLTLPAGATVQDAITASGLPQRHPGLVVADAGIWGRIVGAMHPLRDGDRVELYRPLRIDPMDARRERHRHQRQARGKPARPARAG